jgi:hypothetical protein
LVLLSDESFLNSFFKEIEDLKVLRQKLMQAESLIERELLEKIEQTLKDRIDILAMIDAILTIHAERSIDDKSFCDMDLHSSLNQNVFQYAGLTYYATIGLALTQADLKYFFTLNHKKCPFERGGQYLLCLPNHAMGLAVDYCAEAWTNQQQNREFPLEQQQQTQVNKIHLRNHSFE